MIDDIERAVARRARARARIALAMLTVALAACGGGGGGASPTPPAPPPAALPTLAVTAATAAAVAGSEAIALHADVTGTSVVPTWTLDGPGTMSAADGVDVKYVPPDTESLDDAATAKVSATLTVTYHAGEQITRTQQVQIALTPAVVAGHHWTTERAAGRGWQDVAYGNGQYVAVGYQGALARSTDGQAWTIDESIPWQVGLGGVAWGDAGWVAVGDSGDVLTSLDGLTWAQGHLPDGHGGRRITFGNHVYVVTGYGSDSLASTDGVTWTPTDVPLLEAAYGNGMFMGLVYGSNGYRLPYASTDGVHWTPVTVPASLTSIAFADGQFNADSPSAGWEYDTLDGGMWIGFTAGSDLHGAELRSAGDTLFEPGTDDMGVALPGDFWQRVTTGDFLVQPAAMAWGPAGYVGVSPYGWISHSTDALNWTPVVEGSVGDLTAVDWIGDRFVAVSTFGWALQSIDGHTWTRSRMGAPALFYDPQFAALSLAHGNGVLVATGASGNAFTQYDDVGAWRRSTDGVTWTPASTPAPARRVAGVIFDGRRFLAIDADAHVYASSDGDAWSPIGTVPTTAMMSGIAFGHGVYLAYGDKGTLAISSDAANWVLEAGVPAGQADNPPGPATLASVLWDGTRFVATSRGYTKAVSSDGRSWSVDAEGLPLVGLAACDGEIVGVGRGAVQTTLDGRKWATRLWEGEPDLRAAACTHGRFVAVGGGGAVVSSSH